MSCGEVPPDIVYHWLVEFDFDLLTITFSINKPIDALVEPIVGGLDLLRVLKINIFTFCFILKLGKNDPVYHSKQNFKPSKNILDIKNSPPYYYDLCLLL